MKIAVEFELDDKTGNFVAVKPLTDGATTGTTSAPQEPHAWVSTIITTKKNPTCMYIWTGSGWVWVCV